MAEGKTEHMALAGVRVLDLSRVLAGPWSTQILGDLGADVIKVERPETGDDTRSWGPPFLTKDESGRGDAAYFLCANRNKRSIAIDFAKPEGAEIVRRLARRAHIVVENFKTGALAKYGLDYPSLAALNPALVYCSITGFGQTGPYAKRPGYDFMIQAMGGLMSLTGEPGGEPMKSAVAIADLFTGMYAVTATLAALRHAERTGVGQHVDVSLLDSQLAMMSNLAANTLLTGEQPDRLGNHHASIAPYQVFATADGHMVLAIGNNGQFQDFCRSAGLPIASDPRFASNELRVLNRDALTEAIASALLERTTADWIAALETAEVPCGPINTLPQAFAEPHVVDRGAVQTMMRADGTQVRVVGSPIRMSHTPPAAHRAPPLLGEHSDAVLRDWLSASDGDLQTWRESGAI